MKSLSPTHIKFYRQINLLLTFIFFIKLGGFFTWSENVNITRVVKIFSRVCMTIAIIQVHAKIVSKGAVASFKWNNIYSPVFYCAYLSLGLISFLWSTNVGYSSLQWFMDAESLVFAFYFIRCFVLLDYYFPGSGIKLYKVLANGILLMIAIFLIGLYVDPDHFYRMTHGGEEARLGGFFMNPNELGMLAAVGVSCFIFDFYKKKQTVFAIIKIIILMYAIVLTGSRSTTIGCLLIAFFHIRQSSNKKLKTAMYAGVLLIIPVAINTMVIKQNGGGLDEVLSLTGRLPFWHALLTEGLPKEPFLGFGFMRIAYGEYFQSVHTYAGQMTHDTFIQVLMNLGFVGLAIVLFQMIFTFRGFAKAHEKEKRLLCLGIIIPVLINSFTEFGIFGETNYGILFYQFLIFYISVSINTRLTPAENIYLKKRRPEFALA